MVASWGRLGQVAHHIARPAFQDEALTAMQAPGPPILCYGMGRSYGDVCLTENGRLLVTSWLDRVIAFDRERGIIRAEAGLTFDRLLRLIVPHGWFVPVSPGTKFATLGGAVANDVHGKNHESAGTFGCYVLRLCLARSSGEVLILSAEENSALFAATIGGLGLTGLILWIELQLIPVRSAFMLSETLPMSGLDDFFRLAETSRDWSHTVAWVDCLASGRAVGRGFFVRGCHVETGELSVHSAGRLTVPVEGPPRLLNAYTISLFNALYRCRPWALGRKTMHYDPFFYPLDSVGRWNRLYGPRGFFQHQSVVPMTNAMDTVRNLLELTARYGEGSFLVVLKLFGNRRSAGVLSFPMAGATLALDFPNKGDSTRQLLARMAEEVARAGGRLYPAKDASMSAEVFRAGYPQWRKVESLRDPAIMSDFWRRVTGRTV
jgi:L-gulonolactone oxidase